MDEPTVVHARQDNNHNNNNFIFLLFHHSYSTPHPPPVFPFLLLLGWLLVHDSASLDMLGWNEFYGFHFQCIVRACVCLCVSQMEPNVNGEHYEYVNFEGIQVRFRLMQSLCQPTGQCTHRRMWALFWLSSAIIVCEYWFETVCWTCTPYCVLCDMCIGEFNLFLVILLVLHMPLFVTTTIAIIDFLSLVATTEKIIHAINAPYTPHIRIRPQWFR